MDETVETLMVDVRASTSGFRADVETMRSAVDTSLVDGFSRAGTVLERGLLLRGVLGDLVERSEPGTVGARGNLVRFLGHALSEVRAREMGGQLAVFG